MENELNKNNLRHIWTGYDNASLEYVIFKFNSLPKKDDEIEYLDKKDNSIRKAKVENIFRDDGYVSLEVYDYIFKGYRSFELEKGSKTVFNEILDHEPVEVDRTPKVFLLLYKLFPSLTEESKDKRKGERIRENIITKNPEVTVKFLSPYSIDECYGRLNDVVDSPDSEPKTKQVIGKISKYYLQLWKRTKLADNSHVLDFYIIFDKHSKGIISHGYFATSYYAKFGLCFLAAIYIILPIQSWFLFFKNLIQGTQTVKPLVIFALTPIAIIISGIYAFISIKKQIRNEKSFLKKFLIELLDAEEI